MSYQFVDYIKDVKIENIQVCLGCEELDTLRDC